MDSIDNAVKKLRFQIHEVESQLAILKLQLTKIEQSASSNPANPRLLSASEPNISPNQPTAPTANGDRRWPLDAEEYKRYGRQMIVPEIGLKGQLGLRNASILIIGIGGLGCPAAAYLAGAGVGTLGLLDGDIVEISNLHRQILHTSDQTGWLKVDSAIQSLKKSNPKVNYRPHPFHLEIVNALEVIDQYDLILDCTDHPTSRYLISDAAVIAGKPLLSASALRTEGQLLVLNNPPSTFSARDTGFCYRCVFPKPPPAESIVGCGEGGILGPVVGVMGVLMANEAIKMIVANGNLPGRLETNSATQPQIIAPSLLLYSAYSNPPFRNIRLRGKRPDCPSCSASTIITRHTLTTESINYPSFCGIKAPPNVLLTHDRISASSYRELYPNAGTSHTLVDVRDKLQFEMCHLERSINIPFSVIEAADMKGFDATEEGVTDNTSEHALYKRLKARSDPVYFICRHGNDSQLAAQELKSATEASAHGGRVVNDITGGLAAWRREVDAGFPDY